MSRPTRPHPTSVPAPTPLSSPPALPAPVPAPPVPARTDVRSIRPRGRPAHLKTPTGPRTWSRGFLKVDTILKPVDRADYEALLCDPKTTVLAALQWLRDRGYEVGYSAVANHFRPFLARRRELERAATAAVAFARAAGAAGDRAFPAAALARIQQIAFVRLLGQDEVENRSGPGPDDDAEAAGGSVAGPKTLPTKDLGDLTKIVAAGIAARVRLEGLQKLLDAVRGVVRKAPRECDLETIRQVCLLLNVPEGEDPEI